MDKVIDFFYKNYIFVLILYTIIILVLIFLILKFIKYYFGNFHEANIFRRLKKLYNKYDYPYIQQIILPINKETYAYYDAIVFGDKFIYLLEIKNHIGKVFIDPLDDWTYYDKKGQEHHFMNPFYELELKKHIINRFLEVDKNRIIEITVYNTKTKPQGNKGKNHLIAVNQISSLIQYYEKKENITKFSPDAIEDKGNNILEINVKKKSIRRKVINDLKNQRAKR